MSASSMKRYSWTYLRTCIVRVFSRCVCFRWPKTVERDANNSADDYTMLTVIKTRTAAVTTTATATATSWSLRGHIVSPPFRTMATKTSESTTARPSVYKAWTFGSTREKQTTIPTVPLNKLQGRTVPVALRGVAGLPTGDVLGAFRRLEGLLRRNNVRKEVKLNRFYEKPSTKRKRLKMEQNRKLFGDLVKRKLRLVMEMKSRGM